MALSTSLGVITLGDAIGGTAIVADGTSFGIDVDIAMPIIESLTVPTGGVFIKYQPWIKGTCKDFTVAILDALWGTTATGDLALPTDKDVPLIDTAPSLLTTDDMIFSLTKVIASNYGEYTLANGDYVSCGLQLDGVSTDGSTKVGTFAAA